MANPSIQRSLSGHRPRGSWFASFVVVAAAFSGCGLQTQGSAFSGAASGASSSGSSASSSSGGEVCVPGATKPCYSGAAGTEGVGVCVGGVATCEADGISFGPCQGEVTPIKEDCATSDVDEDCDGTAAGAVDDNCLCAPGSVSACVTPLLGVCKAGEQICDPSGTAFGMCASKVAASFDDCKTPTDEDCDGAALMCLGTPLVGASFGAAGADTVGLGVAADSSGDAIIGGYKAGQFWLIKLDPKGTVLWEKAITATGAGAGGSVNGVAVAADDSIVVAGGFVGSLDLGAGAMNAGLGTDIFVAKFDPDGLLLWSQSFGDGPVGAALHRANNVALSAAGDIFITGTASGMTTFGSATFTANAEDLFVAKLDAKGAALWAVRSGDAAVQAGIAIGVDAAGDAFVAGTNRGAMDLGGPNIASAAGLDAFLAKFSGVDGKTAWSRAITDVADGDLFDQEARGMTLDSKGDVLVVGRFRKAIDLAGITLNNMDALGNSSDIFVAKYDTGGTLKWAKSFGDAAGTQGGDDVSVDGADNIVLGGYLRSPFSMGGAVLTLAEAPGGNYDFWIAKLDPDGAHLWSSRFGDVGNEFIYSIATDAKGNVLATGDFTDSITLPGSGVGPLTSVGGYDAYLLKLAP